MPRTSSCRGGGASPPPSPAGAFLAAIAKSLAIASAAYVGRARHPSPLKGRRGFTLLEMIIVVAIMAFAVAMVVPNIKRQIAENATQGRFIVFQRQITGYRAQAYRQNLAITLRSTGEESQDPDELAGEAQLCGPDEQPCLWSYRLSEPMVISAGGVCSAVEADILSGNEVAAHLESRPDCHFVRVRT